MIYYSMGPAPIVSWRHLWMTPVSIIVANQFYQSSSEEEYVIVGNDAIVKCKIPSFVADFVSVVGWQDNEEKVFYENKDYGKTNGEIIS